MPRRLRQKTEARRGVSAGNKKNRIATQMREKSNRAGISQFGVDIYDVDVL